MVSQIGQELMWHNISGYSNSNLDIMEMLYGTMLKIEKGMGIAKIYLNQAEVKNPEDDEGNSPLRYAALDGQTGLYKLFSDHLVDKNPVVTKGCFKGKTMLHLAARNGHFEICQFIIANTQDKNPVSTGDFKTTPLHEVVKYGHLKICKLLIDNMDDKLSMSDGDGMTPIDYARRYRQNGEVFEEIVKLLEPFQP